MLELNSQFRCDKRHRARLVFFLALIVAPAFLVSCGSSSSSTTTAPSVVVLCNPIQVTLTGTSTCTATVTNESSTLVNWSISPAGTGQISSGGVYTAPSTFPANNQNIITITATSVVASSVTGTATVTIMQPTTISAVTCLDPVTNLAATTVASGNQLACTATTSTAVTVPVNWAIASANQLGGNIGTISLGGSYTAPLVPPPGQMVTITATSQALSTETMSVTITVVFGNKILSGPFVFSTHGRVTNSTNAFFARVGSFTAGGGDPTGSLTGIEDTNQAGTSGTVKTQRSFTGSYSIGPDGRGTMQFCEDTNAGCPPGSPSATAFFRVVVVSPVHAEIIEFSSPGISSASTTARGEIVAQDQSVFGAGDGNLSGTYSFNFYGVSSASAVESAVGEFTADGHGAVAAGGASMPGEVDIDSNGPQSLASSAYSINSNGRGTMTLGGLAFSFYVASASQAIFMETDSAPASILAGDAYKQQVSVACGWGLNALSNSVVFETSGAASGAEIADLGSFTATNNGATGTVIAGSLDENDGGSVPPPALGTLSGNYTVDPCGRGTLSIGAHSYVFYPISAGSAVFQETTSGVVARGFLTQSQGGPFVVASLTGSYALQLSGTDAPGTSGKREDILGQITSAGSGKGLSGTLDINDFGVTTGQTGVAISNGTYLPVPAGSLRGTVALSSTRNLALYLVSPTLFYILDTDTTGTAIGALYNQF